MSEQTNVVPLREFNEVIRITNRKLESIQQSETKTKSLQIEVGKLLIELRERVDAGEIGELATWWEWFDDNRIQFRNIERKTAERYMWFAGDSDPEAKLAAYKEAEASRMRTLRSVRTLQNNQAKSKVMGDSAAAHALNQEEVDSQQLKGVTRIQASPKPPPSPEDDALVAQFLELFRKMSDETRVRAMQEINALYRRWREGEE